MKNKHPLIIVIYQLGVGGLSSAIKSQIKHFTAAGYDVSLATFNHDFKFREKMDFEKRAQEIPEITRIHNIHENYSGEVTAFSRTTSAFLKLFHKVQMRFLKRGRIIKNTEKGVAKTTFFSRNGQMKGSISKQLKHGTVVQWEKTKKDCVTTHHYKNNVRFLLTRHRVGDKFPYKEIYFSTDQFAYLERWRNPQKGHGVRVFAFKKKRKKGTQFSGLPGWQTQWLQSVVNETFRTTGLKPIVIGQSPSVIPKVARLDSATCIKVGKLHNNHNAYPYTQGSGVREDHAEILKNISDLDSLVVLTNKQKEDLREFYNIDEKVTVIPNLVLPRKTIDTERSPFTIGVIARLDPLKQLDHVLYAFKDVLKEKPQARLIFWGRGKAEKDLKDLAISLGIEENVIFKGYVTDVDEAYNQILFNVSTSKSESFSLSIAEAALNSTTTIAYDCPFGPQSLIQHKKTGLLVTPDDLQSLSKSMIFLLDNPDVAKEFGKAAKKFVSPIVSPSDVLVKWEALFFDLISEHNFLK